tara:strand:+ start:387 stop:908 length:522 start_codon:yes stop_codon:yes gene_type:complete
MIVSEHTIRDIVATIPQIRINPGTTRYPKFHWGDEDELNRYVQLMKEDSYPLIWLLPSDDNYEGSLGQDLTKECSFIIATRETRQAMFNNERYNTSFDIVLQPLTEKLIHGLSVSSLTSRIGDKWKILKLPNFSAESDKNGTIDLWDAISLTIEIRFNSNSKNCLKPINYGSN